MHRAWHNVLTLSLCVIVAAMAPWSLFAVYHTEGGMRLSSNRGLLRDLGPSALARNASRGWVARRQLPAEAAEDEAKAAVPKARVSSSRAAKKRRLIVVWVDALRWDDVLEGEFHAVLDAHDGGGRRNGGEGGHQRDGHGSEKRGQHSTRDPREARGARARDCLLVKLGVQLPTLTLPNAVSLFTGVPPAYSGVQGNAWSVDWRRFVADEHSVKGEVPFPSVFSDAAWHGLSTRLWTVDEMRAKVQGKREQDRQLHYLYSMFNHSALPASVRKAGWDVFSQHHSGEEIARQVLERDDALQLVYYHEVDRLGHRSALTPEFARAKRRAADVLGTLIRESDEDTVVALVSDHGHVDIGGHGGATDHERFAPFMMCRKGSRVGDQPDMTAARVQDARKEQEAMDSNLSVSPSLAVVLGLPPPEFSFGVPLELAFRVANVSAAERAALERSSVLQQTALLHTVSHRTDMSMPEQDMRNAHERLLDVVERHSDSYVVIPIVSALVCLVLAAALWGALYATSSQPVQGSLPAAAALGMALVPLVCFSVWAFVVSPADASGSDNPLWDALTMFQRPGHISFVKRMRVASGVYAGVAWLGVQAALRRRGLSRAAAFNKVLAVALSTVQLVLLALGSSKCFLMLGLWESPYFSRSGSETLTWQAANSLEMILPLQAVFALGALALNVASKQGCVGRGSTVHLYERMPGSGDDGELKCGGENEADEDECRDNLV